MLWFEIPCAFYSCWPKYFLWCFKLWPWSLSRWKQAYMRTRRQPSLSQMGYQSPILVVSPYPLWMRMCYDIHTISSCFNLQVRRYLCCALLYLSLELLCKLFSRVMFNVAMVCYLLKLGWIGRKKKKTSSHILKVLILMWKLNG